MPVNRRFKPQFSRGPNGPQKLIRRPGFNEHYENYPDTYGNPPINGNYPDINRNPGSNRNFANNNGNRRTFNSNYPNSNSPNPNLVGNNPNFNRNNPYNQNPNMNGGNIRNQGSIRNTGNVGQALGGQCSDLTSFPPEPQTGCCGREEVLSDRTAGKIY